MEKQGRHLDVGLTADQILEATRKEEARNKENMEDMVVIPQPVMGNILQGGSPAPFTGPLEDLFTCSASPEDLLLPLPSPPLSPDAESLFEVSSPTESVTDYDESDHAAWDWFPMHQFPTIMKLVGAAETEQDKPVDMEELRRWSESIMA
jgi:hypothetical protein